MLHYSIDSLDSPVEWYTADHVTYGPRKPDGIILATHIRKEMTIRVYLQGDKVTKLEGFDTKQKRDRENNTWNENSINGLRLYPDKGNGLWYIESSDLNDSVPEWVADIVEEISCQDTFALWPERETGIYRYASAEGELNRTDDYHSIRIRAKTIDDMRKLFRKIRGGAIRPKVSYENVQDS